MSYVVGIDPGRESGAIAFLPMDIDKPVVVSDLPLDDTGQIDVLRLSKLLKSRPVLSAVVERVHGTPKQSATTGFVFGEVYGRILATLALAGISTHLVAPSRWKAGMRLAGNPGKERSRLLALRLYPRARGLELKKHHNRAEALLIAHHHLYGPLTRETAA